MVESRARLCYSKTMRLRLTLGLGLCLACNSGGEGSEFAESVTRGDNSSYDPDSSSDPGSSAASSTGDGEPTTDASTGLPELTSGTTGDDPSLGTTTGLDPTTGTTAGETGETGGPPADCPRVRVQVAPGDVLNVRPTPSTAMEPVGTLANGTLADVVEIVQGEVLEGNGEWMQIEAGMLTGYVWGGLVECTTDEAATDGFFLPLECGMTATISQGNFGDFSHQGNSAYAFDFSLGSGTPLVAIADGTVSHMYGDTMPGDPCYNGGGQECNSAANFVTLLHSDGTASIYGHLSEVHVELGEFVPRGLAIGLSGSTGWSTGPHAHVAREEACAFGWCQSIAVTFTDVPGDGVPTTGQLVTSGNCP